MAITTRGNKPPASTAILFAKSSSNINQPTTELTDEGYAQNSRPGSANYNWLFNYVTAGVTHCFVYGVPVYDETETYNTYSFVNRNGVIYKSLQTNNTGNLPETAGSIYWNDTRSAKTKTIVSSGAITLGGYNWEIRVDLSSIDITINQLPTPDYIGQKVHIFATGNNKATVNSGTGLASAISFTQNDGGLFLTGVDTNNDGVADSWRNSSDTCTGNSGTTYLRARCEALGFSYDATDIYLPEKISEAERGQTGDVEFSIIETDPVEFSAARTTSNPTNPKYNPRIPIYDKNHDISTTQVCQQDVDLFRSKVFKVGNNSTYQFSATLASGVLTMPTSDDGSAMVTAIVGMAMVNRYYASSESADYASLGALYTGYRQYTARINGTDYPISNASVAGNTITLSSYPADGTYSVEFHPFAISGSTTAFRLRRVSGAAPFASNDFTGEILSGGAGMDMMQGFKLKSGIASQFPNATDIDSQFGGDSTTLNLIAGDGVAVAYAVHTSNNFLNSGYGTPRINKNTRGMHFGVLPYVKVSGLLATSWTNND